MPAGSSRQSSILITTLVAVLLATHAGLGWSATAGLGLTSDESAHVVAGYSYWRFNDYRLQPENGNLPQRWGALPLLALRPRLQPAQDPAPWRYSHVWAVAERFLFRSGNPVDYLLLCGRAAMTLWSVAAGCLVFSWSRRLWGNGGAILSLALFACSPTLLAHGPLVTSDVCGAVCLLAATGAWWRTTGEPTWRNIAMSCGVTGLAFVAKFSCVLLIPIFAVLLLVRVARAEPMQGPSWRGRPLILAGRGPKLAALLALGAVHAVAAGLVIWTFFGWRYSGFAPGLPEGVKYFFTWEKMLPEPGLLRSLVELARAWHLLPEAYLNGFCHVVYQGSARGAFLVGNFSTTGWWWFFPFAFLVKSSLAELTTTAAIAILLVLRLARPGQDAARRLSRIAPLLVFALVYGVSAVLSHLNIGQRHILPLYLVLFIGAGAIVAHLPRLAAVALAGALVLAGAIESSLVRPNYLAFFNAAAGGPSNGWRLLVDSSLDWGQTLPATAQWLADHQKPGETVYLSYFGTDNPRYRGIDAIELSPYFAVGRTLDWHELGPGLYCISATLLQDVYSPVHGSWTMQNEFAYQALLSRLRQEIASGRRSRSLGVFGQGPEGPLWNLDRLRFARLTMYLRVRPPDAVISHAVFVFRLSAEEIRIAVDGTLAELAAAMDRVARAPRQGN